MLSGIKKINNWLTHLWKKSRFSFGSTTWIDTFVTSVRSFSFVTTASKSYNFLPNFSISSMTVIVPVCSSTANGTAKIKLQHHIYISNNTSQVSEKKKKFSIKLLFYIFTTSTKFIYLIILFLYFSLLFIIIAFHCLTLKSFIFDFFFLDLPPSR